MKKKEMTRIRNNGIMEVVTLLEYVPQEIVRFKTEEKDGYNAVVLGVDKKNKEVKSYEKKFKKLYEFKIDEEFKSKVDGKNILDFDVLDFSDVGLIDVVSISKGKGYQGAMKRFGLAGGPETHGSKFHRQVGSLGNRKPRRVLKGHPHAGRMGGDKITLKKIKVVDVLKDGYGSDLLIVKGSIPGGYNSYVKVIIKK